MRLSLSAFTILATSVAAFGHISNNNIIKYAGECYKFDSNTGNYVLVDVQNYSSASVNINDIINKLKTGIKQNSSGYKCDKFVVYYTTPQPNKSEGVTIEKMAKPVNILSKSDFVSIKQNDSSYFIGIASKLNGAGVGYWISRGEEIGKNKTIKHTFSIERVNWLYFFANYIKNYCKQTNGIPPYIIYNQMAFLNATGAIGDYLKQHPDAMVNTIDSNTVPALKNPGFFKVSSDICKESLPQIENDLKNIKTVTQGTGSGYHYTVYNDQGNNLFEDNGFVINYPYIDFEHTAQIMGEFFTTFMFANNIPRGIMFTDQKINVHTEHWTTGKWPWQKKKHSRRTFNTGSQSYDIIYAQYIEPFGSYSFTKDWSNIDLSYVASVNNLPSVTRELIMLTPDNHQITHVFKKGGEISNIGSWSLSREVERKVGFNWVKFVLIVAAAGTLIYTGALFFTSGLASGGLSFSTYLNFISAYPSALFGGLTGAGGLIGAGGALGIAGLTLAGSASTIANWCVKNPAFTPQNNGVFSQIMKDLSNDVISTSSIRVQQIQTIPHMIEKLNTQTLVPPKIYRVVLRNSPTLGNTNNVIPISEFISQYGSYFNMYMYANHTDLGKDFYSGGEVVNWARNFVNNMEMKRNGGYMCPESAINTIMQREWNSN